MRWEVLPAAATVLEDVRASMSPDAFNADRGSLRLFLCAYFNSNQRDCTEKLGKSISPVGFKTPNGGKCLKVRWLIPGRGKSGGLRIAVVAYCDAKRVKIAGAWIRKTDPGDEELAAAFGAT